MANVTIRFEGIMMFYKPGGSGNSRVLVVSYAEDGDSTVYQRIPAHFAQLAFRSMAFLKQTGWGQSNPYHHHPGYDYYDLQGFVISIVNKSPPLTVDPSFALVPSL